MREKSEQELREEREWEEQKMLEERWEVMSEISTKGTFLFRITPNRDMASSVLNRAVEELQKMVIINKEAQKNRDATIIELSDRIKKLENEKGFEVINVPTEEDSEKIYKELNDADAITERDIT